MLHWKKREGFTGTVEKNLFNLLITDINRPRLEGLELIRPMKKWAQGKDHVDQRRSG